MSVEQVRRTPFQVWKTVIFALMMREMRNRFGEFNLGYFWVLLEPAAHVGALSMMYMVVGSRSTLFNVDAPVFIIMGIVPWVMFRSMVTKQLDAIKANKSLFDYRQVKPIDAFFTRALLEGVIGVVVFLVFLTIAAWAGFEIPIDDPLMLGFVFALLFVLGLGSGLFCGVVSAKFNEFRQFVKVFLRPMYFVSGVFFAMGMVPEKALVYLIWNPVFHALDLIKGAMIPQYDSPASLSYLGFFAFSTVILGLMYYQQNLKILRNQ